MNKTGKGADSWKTLSMLQLVIEECRRGVVETC